MNKPDEIDLTGWHIAGSGITSWGQITEIDLQARIERLQAYAEYLESLLLAILNPEVES